MTPGLVAAADQQRLILVAADMGGHLRRGRIEGILPGTLTKVGTVPDQLRPAIADELTELVEGRLPEQLLLWVREYSQGGATLVPQPEEIWSHPRADVTKVDTGGYLVVVPLWTADESPSDLSAEMMISPEGTVTINTVRIL